MSKKTLRSALITSVASLVLCFAMLLGATYAWFSSSVTSSNNVIKIAGFDLDIEWMTNEAGSDWDELTTTAIFGKNEDIDLNDAALLPGDKTKIVFIRVTNNSDCPVDATVTFTLAEGTTSPLYYHFAVLSADQTVASVDYDDLTQGNALFTTFSVLTNEHILAGGSKIVAVAFELPNTNQDQTSLVNTTTTFDIYVLGSQSES